MASLGPDLLLDPDSHDLAVSGGDLQLSIDVAQAVKIRLLFVRNDWFLNMKIGLPYFEQIFVKNPPIDQLTALFREEIASTPGIIRVLDVRVEIDKQTRRLAVTWSAETTEGEIGTIVEVA